MASGSIAIMAGLALALTTVDAALSAPTTEIDCPRLEKAAALTDYCRGYLEGLRQSGLLHGKQKVVSKNPPGETAGRHQAVADVIVPVSTAPSPLQKWFFRSDLLDNRFYGFGGSGSTQIVGSGLAKGASFSYTDNRLAQTSTGAISPTQNVTINGVASYLLLPNGFVFLPGGNLEFAPAAWLSANGTWDDPLKKFGEFSALKTGLDLQLKHDGGISEAQYLEVSPYFQSDFYGGAKAEGVAVAAEVVRSDMYLGASPGVTNSFLDGYVAIRPEFVHLTVENVGQTNLVRGDYDWFGGTIRAYLFLFPSCTAAQSDHCQLAWPTSLATALVDRFAVIGTAQYYWDARSSTEVRYYSAELQYNLAGCKMVGSCAGGTAAVSVEYDWGTDRDTLVNYSRYLGKVSYKY
jgi:hypothetical protein